MPQSEREDKKSVSEGGMIKDGGTVVEVDRGSIYCLTIIGQIEGHYVLDSSQKTTKYDHVIPTLVAIEESSEIDGIIILLNTLGGDVEAGLAISEVIASMSKPTASVVLGGGHSIGVPLAVSANYSFIAPSATMTLHPVRTSGTIINSKQSFDYLNKLQESITDFVVSHSKITKEKFNALLFETSDMANDVGTILFGKETVKCGLIDDIGTIDSAIKKLYSLIKS